MQWAHLNQPVVKGEHLNTSDIQGAYESLLEVQVEHLNRSKVLGGGHLSLSDVSPAELQGAH